MSQTVQTSQLNIQFFGGPGVSKSTSAAGLFWYMKSIGLNAEYIQEYAKDLTYENSNKLSDQLHILGEQHLRLSRLKEVPYVVHDSPFIMGSVYLDDTLIYREEFEKLVLKVYNTYTNLNIFIQRNDDMFKQDGRNENLEEAKLKDQEIKDLLDNNNLKYITIKAGTTPENLYNLLKMMNRI